MAGNTTYNFEYAERCNMCGATPEDFKVLGKRLNVRQGAWPRRKTGMTTTVVKCQACNLVFDNPMPMPMQSAQHYEVPAESYWENDYLLSKYPADTILQQFSELAGAPSVAGLKALDVGAGIGRAVMAFQSRGFDAYGIEPSKEFRNFGLERLGIEPHRLILSSMEDASFPQHSFDFIVFDVVLEHLRDPSAALGKALSWLKPGGLIYVCVPSSKWLMARLVNWSYHMRGLDYVTNTSPMHSPYHLYEFSLDSFRANGSRQGYEVEVHSQNICSTFAPGILGMLDPLFKQLMRMSGTGMEIVVWLRKN